MNKKILLAEDDNDMRRFLVKALENAGFEVSSHDNGLAAYQRLREEPFEMLLTDIVMPEMDGIELARRAAELAGLAPDIASFPDGYGTIIGERGITLSGGQKQRVAIARAILRNPKILILDDALASVDTLTEERILTGLAGVMRGRTTILISHRVSTVQNASQIFVIEHGEVAEQGTHAELIRNGGYYADLYQKQLLEEELETI